MILTRIAHSRLVLLIALSGAAMLWNGLAQAQDRLDQATAIGTATVAPPAEYSFTTTTAQALTVTLTDLATPAAFASLQIAVTLGDTLVGSATVQTGSTSATVAVPAAIGTYTLHVIGTPATASGVGSFGVCVALASGPATTCIGADSFSGTLQMPATPTTASTPLLANFTTTANAGSYTVTITDDQFPVPLSTTAPISGGIFQGGTPTFGPLAPGANTVPGLAANTSYELLLAAVPAQTGGAGLYSVLITDPNGTVVFSRTVPVGSLQAATSINNPSAQSLQLSVTDEAYPAALSSLGAAVTSGATLLTPPLTASGTSPSFSAPAGNLQVWQYAAANGQSPGVYTLTLNNGPTKLLATTQIAQPSNGSGANSFGFVVDLPASGSYTVAVNDFQFPVALQSSSFTVGQNGIALTTNSSGVFTAMAGPAVIIVNAQSAANTIGLFAVTVTASGAATPLFDQLQAVGGTVTTSTINFGAAGAYNVSLADLAFPAAFQNLAVVVSSGGQVVGKIYANGSFPFTAAPGEYELTYVTNPNPQDNYGLYGVQISPALPTVTLSANPTTVSIGQATQLTWSSQNATSCTASGATGWDGSESLSGSTGVTISASVTLSLVCTGLGGASQPQTVSITATPAKTNSGGGGGSVDLASLAILSGLWLAALRRRQEHFSP